MKNETRCEFQNSGVLSPGESGRRLEESANGSTVHGSEAFYLPLVAEFVMGRCVASGQV